MNQAQTAGAAKWKNLAIKVGAGFAVVFVGLQFVPLGKLDIPTAKVTWDEPADVTAILRRACFDCHSDEIRFPWYSQVAPMSWLVVRDIVEGRKAFNFSEWPEDEDDRQFNRETAWEQIEGGEMPPWFYTYPMHMEAKLSEQDMAVLKAWGSEKEDEEEGDDDDEE